MFRTKNSPRRSSAGLMQKSGEAGGASARSPEKAPTRRSITAKRSDPKTPMASRVGSFFCLAYVLREKYYFLLFLSTRNFIRQDGPSLLNSALSPKFILYGASSVSGSHFGIGFPFASRPFGSPERMKFAQ